MVQLFASSAAFLFSGHSLLLIGGGFLVGILGVVFGGGLFFSVPLVQWLFTSVSFGAVVGNIKVGSFFRSIGSTWTTRRQIQYWRNVEISIFAFAGTILGAFVVSYLSQAWLLPATIISVLCAEFAPKLARYITDNTFHIAAFICGFYAGTFGAGIGLLLVALLRLKYPFDSDIAFVKIQARFVECMLVIVAVATFWYSGSLLYQIWIPWSIGSLLGGYIGGIVLMHVSKYSAKFQKTILRIAYVISIATAALHF